MREIIHWVGEPSNKFSDQNNNLWLHPDPYDGKYRVCARYGFDDGGDKSDIRSFDTFEEAAVFYFNYVYSYYLRFEKP